MDSKRLFKALFSHGELPRPFYLPLACSLAAKLRQASLPELFSNPTLYANALRDAQRLFGFDALVTSFDPTLEAEALGCKIQWESPDRLPRVISHPLAEGRALADLEPLWETRGRLSVVLEVTRRLVLLLSKELPILGAMTGPFTLARQLQGDSFLSELAGDSPRAQELLDFVGQCHARLVRRYAELKVDGLLLIEDQFHPLAGPSIQRLSPILQSLANLLDYFGIPFVLLAHGCRAEQIHSMVTLPVNGLILDVRSDDQEVQSPDRSLATPIPTDLLLGDSTQIGEALGNLWQGDRGRGGSFLANDWEIPYHTPAQNIHEIMKSIKNRSR